MEHSSEKFRALWLEVSQHVSANDHELEEKAAFLQQQEQKFINVVEASRTLDKSCTPREQRERDEVVHLHFKRLYNLRRILSDDRPNTLLNFFRGTIAGDTYFSAHQDIRLILDVFAQVPLPPGVHEHEVIPFSGRF